MISAQFYRRTEKVSNFWLYLRDKNTFDFKCPLPIPDWEIVNCIILVITFFFFTLSSVFNLWTPISSYLKSSNYVPDLINFLVPTLSVFSSQMNILIVNRNKDENIVLISLRNLCWSMFKLVPWEIFWKTDIG